MHQSQLGWELLDLCIDVVDRDAKNSKYFKSVQSLAKATDSGTREHAVIVNRSKMQRLMSVMSSDAATYRAHMDRTMRVVLDLPTGEVSWTRWIQRYVGKYLMMFMQGITLFAARDEGVAVGHPAYHRVTSCGPWDPSHPELSAAFERDHLTCDPTLSPQELERRRRNIWTCLVERLVYEEMYSHFIGGQDTGHLHNAQRVTRQLFERCFALNHLAVAVNVTFDSNGSPVGMLLQYSTPIDRVSEQFTRQPTASGGLYGLDVVVRVKREVRPARGAEGPGDEYERIQSYFQEPAQWLPVSPGAPPITGGGGWTSNRPHAPDPWAGRFPKRART